MGASDFFDSGSLGARLSTTVSNLPADDGLPIFVRLWYRSASAWLFTDFAYTIEARNLKVKVLKACPTCRLPAAPTCNQVRSGGMQCRQQTEHEAREQGKEEGKAEYSVIQAQRLDSRKISRLRGHKKFDPPLGEQETEATPKQCKHTAFGQQLTQQAPPTAAVPGRGV